PCLLIRFAPALDRRGERLAALVDHLPALLRGLGGAIAPFARLFTEVFPRLTAGGRRIQQGDRGAADGSEQERQQNASRAASLISRHDSSPQSAAAASGRLPVVVTTGSLSR